MTIGTTYPPEWKTFRDSGTGRAVTQLTNSLAHDYHLYFYNPTITPDGKYLIFLSERTGLSNLFRLELSNGAIVQLSDAAPARADYYPFTYKPFFGVGACLPAIGAGEVFYFVGNALFAVNYETLHTRQLLNLPADRRASMLHTNAAGTTLVFATWDESVFGPWAQRLYSEGIMPQDETYQATSGSIVRVDIPSNTCGQVLNRKHFWINHVLVHPTNSDRIEFCHEYSPFPDRMWLLNAATGEYAPIPGQGDNEWYEHEFWSSDGERICFHAGLNDDKDVGFCGWYNCDTHTYEKFFHRTPGRTYGHYNLHPDGITMITDGEAYPGCISRIHLHDGTQEFEPLCHHDSYRFDDDQRCHPHPSFTPDGTRVIFSSDRTGTTNVYMTDW